MSDRYLLDPTRPPRPLRRARLRFTALRQDAPGRGWADVARRTWPAYERWFLSEGDAARPSYVECRRALTVHMPGLVPLWEQLTALAGDSDHAARLLSLYGPPPHATGCSQAVWHGPPAALVRNYDYHPEACEGVLLHSSWAGTRVLAMSDCLWGVLDGVNEHGLVVSLSFGGRTVSGEGFGITLILRHVLQTCRDVEQAVDVLFRVPSHMTYSVTLLDAAGRAETVWVAPDREPRRAATVPVTNHQAEVEWPEHAAATGSVERAQALGAALDEERSLDDFAARFLRPPLYGTQYARGFGTLYTAVYRPDARAARYLWPGLAWDQSLDAFREGEILVRYPAAAD